MAKIRHIAIRAESPEDVATFFQQAFGLELVQRRPNGAIDLSDGDLNLTLLPWNIGSERYNPGEIRPGYAHIGFTVEDEDATHETLVALGAKTLARPEEGHAYYENKYRGVEGLYIDVGHWQGASPIPTPASTKA